MTQRDESNFPPYSADGRVPAVYQPLKHYTIDVRLGGEGRGWVMVERSLADALAKLAELVREHGPEPEAEDGPGSPRLDIRIRVQ